jgi:hypothetical protein
MGGRYGSSDDGSDDYQSRQPDDDDLSEEQQTALTLSSPLLTDTRTTERVTARGQ